MRRRGNNNQDLPTYNNSNKNGGSRTLSKQQNGKSSKVRRRRRPSSLMASCCKAFWLVLLSLTAASVIVMKWDKAENVRSRVKGWKNKVLGNSAHYSSFDLVQRVLETAPKVLHNNSTYVVIVTASNGRKDSNSNNLHVGVGYSTNSSKDALTKAQERLPRRTNTYPYIKIDVVTQIVTLTDLNYFEELSEPFDYYGVALEWNDVDDVDSDSPAVFTPEEVVANAIVDGNGLLRWERLALYTARSRQRSRRSMSVVPDLADDSTMLEELSFFTTHSVFLDLQHDEVVPLYHGHRLFTEKDILTKPKILRDAAKAAGNHLGLSVHNDGRMVYKYKPRSDLEPFGYNMARHAGTVYAMSNLYRLLRDNDQQQQQHRTDYDFYLESLKLATKYLQDNIADCPVPLTPPTTTAASTSSTDTPKAKCLLDYEPHGHRLSKLGANALTLLAMVEYMDATKTTEYVNTCIGLARYLMGSQRNDGSFVQRVYLGYQPSGDPIALERLDEDYFVRYYAGEVMYALTKLWRYHKNNHWKAASTTVAENWLDVATKAANYIVETDSKQDNDAKFVFDHWLLYGMGEFLKSNQEIPELWSNHAKRSLQVAMKFQNGEVTDDPDAMDELGIYYDNLSSTATATTAEGLCAIYHLFDNEDDHYQDDLVKSMVLSVRYQLQAQYRPELAMHMRDPIRVNGAFRSGIDGFDIRNDFTQHNACSLMCLADVLDKRNAGKTAFR